MHLRVLRDRPAARYILAAGLLAAAMLLRGSLARVAGELPPFVIFFPTVALVALFLGAGPGIVATVVAALVTDFFVFEPVHTFGPTSLSEGVALGLFVSGGLLISLMAGRVVRARRREAAAAERARNAEALQQVESSLRESEERFRALAEGTTVLLWINGPEGCRFANRAYLEYLGVATPEEVRRYDWAEFVHPEDREDYTRAYRDCVQRRIPFEATFRFRRHDGVYRWMQSSAMPRLSDSGELLCYIGSTVDVTQRKETEAQVRLQAAALEAAPNAISISETDREGAIVWVNRAFTTMTGYSAEEALGRSHHILSSGRQDEAFYDKLWETIERGEVWRGELVNRRKDGTLYHEEMGITPLRDDEGRITHYVAVKQDITARRQAEEALRESEAKYRTLFDNMGEEVHFWKLVRDKAGRIRTWRLVEVNPATTKTWGKKLDEIRGKTPDEIFGPGSTDHFMPIVQKVMAEGAPHSFEDHFPPLDKTFRFIIVPLGEYFITTGADITERKQVEESLRRSEQRFRTVAENAQAVVGIVQGQRFVYANPFLTELTGYSGDEILAMDFIHLVRSDYRQMVADYARRRQLGEAVPQHYEFALLTRDGETRWIDLSVGPTIHNGQPAIVGTGYDITERKRAEEALRTALVESQRFREALENVPAYVYMKDLQFRYLYANRLVLELFGCSAEEVVGRDDFCFFPPDSAQRLREIDERVIAGRQSIEEFVGAEIGGRRRVYLEYKTPIYAEPEGKTICGLLGIATDITERKQMEELLEQRVRQRTLDLAKALAEADRGRATLDALLESIPEGITIADAAGFTLRRASRYMAEMLGVEVKTLEGTTAEEFVKRWETFETDGVTPIGMEDLPIVQAIRDGRAVEGRELVYWTKDGARVPILCNAAPIRDSSGHITGGVGAWRDITERQQAEAAVRESEARLRFALDACHIGAWDIDVVDHTAYRSLEHDRIFGYTELLPQWTLEDFLRHTLPEYRDEVEAMVRQATAARTDWTYECRIRRADGEIRWIWFTGSHRTDASGRSRVVGVVQDITERKRSEEDLRRKEAELREAQRVAHMGNWYWDAKTDATSGSDELLRLYGFDPATQTMPNFKDQRERCYSVEEWERVNAAVQRAMQTGEGFELDVRVLRGGSAIWATTRGEVVRDVQGRIVGMRGTVQDITERKQAEELAAARQTAELARSAAEQANQAKDHFLAVLSHELRTPLTPVLPALEELARRVSEEDREDVEMARRNVELEARLIDDLLDLTRIARGKIELHREAVELCTVVRRAAEVCTPDIEARRLHFGIKVEGGPYAVDGDPARLQQVFWNLIKNAIKFTPHGGCVGIHCRSEGDGQVVAEVMDSGIGVEPQALSRIFNAFEQVDRSVTRKFGGLGLGLAICKALVELHGGTIQARSEGEGKGATFTVTLPICTAAAAGMGAPEPGQVIPAASAPVSTRAMDILLVEDHGDTAKILRRILEAEGHRVETAGDVATALEVAGNRSFDLMVSDLGLPDRSGVELVQEMHRLGIGIPSIALSGYGQDEDIRRSREAGFAEHLIKPIKTQALLAALYRVAKAPRSTG